MSRLEALPSGGLESLPSAGLEATTSSGLEAQTGVDLEALALDLAKKVIDAKGGSFKDLGQLNLAKAIVRLGINEFLPGGLTAATAVQDVIAAIAGAQGEAKIGDEPGILGPKTFDWLLIAKRCLGKLKNSRKDLDGKDLPEVKDDPGDKRRPLEIRYFVEKLPTISEGPQRDADILLQLAWESWAQVCGVIATRIPKEADKAKANVVIRMKNIDGPSNILADAHVGPPNRMQLVLAFDALEPWDSDKFQATACHEIGHLLGLRHGGADGIMAATYRGQRKTPHETDAIEARKFWGAAPPTMGTPTDQGGFGSGSGT